MIEKKVVTHEDTDRAKSSMWLMSIVVMMLALPFPASAALGGDVTSVEADQAHMRATLRMTRSEMFNVHEMRAPSGTVVREYVSPAGKVFAVAWQGPWVPDLRQLLGAFFDPYQRAGQTKHAGHGPLLIQQPGLVVQLGGHMRAFFGRAYLPQMLPQGVRAEAIR